MKIAGIEEAAAELARIREVLEALLALEMARSTPEDIGLAATLSIDHLISRRETIAP